METFNSSTKLKVNGDRSQSIKFYTLGCKVNQYETQVIREQFLRANFKEISNGSPTDIYLINTCTVTHKADRNSRHFIKLAHRQNPKAKIVVTGCYTELDADVIRKIPGVTHIVKNKDKYKITELLNKYNGHNENNGLNEPNEIISTFSGHTRAFLKIQDGCDNFCSFCKIPLVRGRSRSRHLGSIVHEARRLVENGFREIVLCGICLGAYGGDLNPQLNLISVIDELEKINGLLRIRLSSIEASYISDGLISKMAQSQKLCRHLHIPLQSGDDQILKEMNRKFLSHNYLNLIKKLKKIIPDIAITTDVMVGFPSETDNNFKRTIGLINKIRPLKTHIFSYSERRGTLACNLDNKVDPKKIKQRVLELSGIAGNCANEYKKALLGKKRPVLIETQDKKEEEYWWGYSDNYLKVRVKSEENLKNRLINTTLRDLNKDFLEANIC